MTLHKIKIYNLYFEISSQYVEYLTKRSCDKPQFLNENAEIMP